jgi:secreted PhoX family phosphatase
MATRSTGIGLSATGTRDDGHGSTRGLIVQNHENINQQYLHPPARPRSAAPAPRAEALKEIECHGVSVTEVMPKAPAAPGP